MYGFMYTRSVEEETCKMAEENSIVPYCIPQMGSIMKKKKYWTEIIEYCNIRNPG